MLRSLSCVVLVVVACNSGKGTSATTPPPSSPATTPAPTVAPAKVTAEVRGQGSEQPLSMAIRVDVAGDVNELVITSTFRDCENAEAVVEKVAALGDDRLRMVQLFCESGEDYFSRSMITALLLADASPRVLWQGEGSYANSMGECEEIDVLSFRKGGDGKVEAVRSTEVVAAEESELCTPAAAQQEVVATIEVPPGAP